MNYNFALVNDFKIKDFSYNTDEKYTLDLSNKQLKELPLNIENTRFKKLILTKNNLTNIDTLFDGELVNYLEELYINWNNIKYIPKTIKKLKKIKILVVADNYLTEIPDEIYKLITLKHLYFDYFPISIPRTGGSVPTSFTIKASNKIKQISPNIKNLIELEDFSVCTYFCESLPREIGNLQKLNLIDFYLGKEAYCVNDCAIISGNSYPTSNLESVKIPINIKNINIVHGDVFNYNDMPPELENLTISFYGDSIPPINNLPPLLKTLNLNIFNLKANSTIGNIRLPFGTELNINNVSIKLQKYDYGEYMNDEKNRYPLYNGSRLENTNLVLVIDGEETKIEQLIREKILKKRKLDHERDIQKLINDKIKLLNDFVN
jgi:hypothetical protein